MILKEKCVDKYYVRGAGTAEFGEGRGKQRRRVNLFFVYRGLNVFQLITWVDLLISKLLTEIS